MFHANAWGYPYTCLMVGAKLVFPGPFLDPESLLDDFEQHARDDHRRRADDLDGHPRHARQGARPLGSLEAALDARRRLGGAARDDRRLPAAARQDRRARLGHDGDLAARNHLRLHRRVPHAPTRRRSSTSSRCRACRSRSSSSARSDDDGKEIPWDGEAMGELEVRGPGSPPATTRRRSRPSAGPTTAGSRPGDIASFHPAGLRDDQGPLEGRDQVRRRVDLVGRPRERADGAPRDRGGGGDRDPAREVGRAAAGGVRAAGGPDRDAGRAARVPRAQLRQVLAARTRSSSSRRSRRRRSASSARPRCGSSSSNEPVSS